MISDEKMTRITALWFPLAAVIAMIGATAWSSWTVSEERVKLNTKIDGVTINLNSLAATVEKLAAKVGQYEPNGDAITRSQWVIECLQTQILNRSNWVCPYALEVAPRRAWGNTTMEPAAMARQ